MIYTKEELYKMERGDALLATSKMLDHPENYDGPCSCLECLTYADDEEY